MAPLSCGARDPHSPGGCRWVLRVPGMALGCCCAKHHRKGRRVQKDVAAGMAGVGLEALGSPSGQEQGVTGSCWDLFCPARKRAPLPDPSQTDRGQRQLQALALLPAPGESCPPVPPRPGLFGKKEGPSSGLPGPAPKPPAHALGAVPTLAGQHLGCWALPAQRPKLSPPLRLPGQCSLCLFCFYDWGRALSQRCTCASSCDPRHEPLRQKP